MESQLIVGLTGRVGHTDCIGGRAAATAGVCGGRIDILVGFGCSCGQADRHLIIVLDLDYRVRLASITACYAVCIVRPCSL